jgi:hypothetical protein
MTGKMMICGVATALALSTALASPALATDMLVVVLEDAAGEKSMHTQMMADCMVFLRAFIKHEREGVPTFLTFKAPPPATGKVLHAVCIQPDGQIVCSKNLANMKCKQGEF